MKNVVYYNDVKSCKMRHEFPVSAIDRAIRRVTKTVRKTEINIFE
jgi:hypothetical protein